MTLRKKLNALVKVIVEEAAQNPSFKEQIEAALDPISTTKKSKPLVGGRKAGRRPPAVLDPIHLAKVGESELREKLSPLDLEELLDIVAEYGMDPGKLVMKWKDRERIISRIIEISLLRATKGDAFRKD